MRMFSRRQGRKPGMVVPDRKVLVDAFRACEFKLIGNPGAKVPRPETVTLTAKLEPLETLISMLANCPEWPKPKRK